jgi:predicted transcriptional regulator of viral defense system
VAPFGELRICLLNGRNTGQLGVIEIDEPKVGRLRVTGIERTLIDAAVRPVYSGGVFEVAQAYKMARERVSINKLVAYLKQLAYTYPYHQAIGFYLDRSGVYKDSQIKLLRQFPMNFDFYLANRMGGGQYNEKWRLFIPQGF